MALRAILVSNNPDFLGAVPANIELRYIAGSALDALIAARDLAHKGWSLANSPLYGNFRPHQQPYRSLVMLPPDSKNQHLQENQDPFTPLRFLESALVLYQGPAPKSWPEDLPEHMRKDCAMIDRELIRATLESLS